MINININYFIILIISIVAIYILFLLFVYLIIKIKRGIYNFINALKNIKLFFRNLKFLFICFDVKKLNIRKWKLGAKKFKDNLYKFSLDLLKKPLVLFLLLSLVIILLSLFIPTILILNKSIKKIFTNMTLVSFSIFVYIFAILRIQVNKELVFLRIIYLYMAFPVAAIYGVYLLIFLTGISKLSILSILMSVTTFVIYALFTFYICYRDVKHKYFRLALSIPIYIVILSYTAFILGVYYYTVFDDLQKINSTDTIAIFNGYTKLGFRFFYSFIDNGHYNKVTLCQYYFGKILDIFMLGFIFYKVTEPKIAEEKVNEQIVNELKITEEKILTNEETQIQNLKQRTEIIKKIKDTNIRKFDK